MMLLVKVAALGANWFINRSFIIYYKYLLNKICMYHIIICDIVIIMLVIIYYYDLFGIGYIGNNSSRSFISVLSLAIIYLLLIKYLYFIYYLYY